MSGHRRQAVAMERPAELRLVGRSKHSATRARSAKFFKNGVYEKPFISVHVISLVKETVHTLEFLDSATH
jgi:hypothetical protein